IFHKGSLMNVRGSGARAQAPLSFPPFLGSAGHSCGGRRRVLVGGVGLPRDLRGVAVLIGREAGCEQAEDPDAHEDHHHECDHREPDATEDRSDVEEHPGRMAGTARIDSMTELPSPAELPASLTIRRGRIVFRARRPVALVLPLLAVTEIAGVICLLIGATIGWFIIAAP